MKSAGRTILFLVASVACYQVKPAQIATPSADWEYCWWTAQNTRLPLDSLSARFRRGYATAGLTPASFVRVGDTISVHAGPAPVGGRFAGRKYESRAVAFAKGDTSLFRYYLAILPAYDGQLTAEDSIGLTARRMEMCSEIARGAGITTWGRRDPNAQDSMKVWSEYGFGH